MKIFAKIWLEWIATPEIRALGRNALLVWICLQAHAAGTRYADTKVAKIVAETGIEESNLAKSFRELEKAGLLTRTIGQGYGKRGHKPTIYTLHPPQSLENAAQIDAHAQVVEVTTCSEAQVVEVTTPPSHNFNSTPVSDTLKKQACNNAISDVSPKPKENKQHLSDPLLNSQIKIPPTPQGGEHGSDSRSGYRNREQRRQNDEARISAELAAKVAREEAQRERRRMLRPRLEAEIKTWNLDTDEQFYLLYAPPESIPPYLQKRLEEWHASQ